jgi:hypothetical protein
MAQFAIVEVELVCQSCSAQIQVPGGMSDEAAKIRHRCKTWA